MYHVILSRRGGSSEHRLGDMCWSREGAKQLTAWCKPWGDTNAVRITEEDDEAPCHVQPTGQPAPGFGVPRILRLPTDYDLTELKKVAGWAPADRLKPLQQQGMPFSLAPLAMHTMHLSWARGTAHLARGTTVTCQNVHIECSPPLTPVVTQSHHVWRLEATYKDDRDWPEPLPEYRAKFAPTASGDSMGNYRIKPQVCLAGSGAIRVCPLYSIQHDRQC